MPLYEYGCRVCGAIVEELRKSGDDKPPMCNCGNEMERKYSGSVSFTFKGHGFHATDYPKPYDDFKDVSKGK